MARPTWPAPSTMIRMTTQPTHLRADATGLRDFTVVTTQIAQFMRQLEGMWDEHVEALIRRHDVDAAMRKMTAEPSVRHLPTRTGADGRSAVASFYHEALLPHLPGDLVLTRRARV